MTSGKGGTKQQVTLFYMSQHFGVCTPADVLKKITVNEKLAWQGYVTTLSAISIDNQNLFGGPTKQGGVQGTCWFLPGSDSQVLPDVLAQRLGRAGGTDCPGYRGLTSAFFIGSGSQRGFYWTANDPYLPGVWLTLTRRPVGLDPDYAMVPRGGEAAQAQQYPVIIATNNTVGSPTNFSQDGQTLYQINGTSLSMWDVSTQTLVSTLTLPHGASAEVAIGPDRIYIQTGPFFSPVLGSYDLGGQDYVELVPTSGFGGADVESCTWAADRVCFYNPVNTAGSILYDPASGSIDAVAISFRPTSYCTDFDDPEMGWVVGTGAVSRTGLYLAPIGGTDETAITGGFNDPAFAMDNGAGQLLVWQQDHFLLVDKTSRTVVATAAATGGVDTARNAFRTVEPGASSLWMANYEYDTLTLALKRVVNTDLWVAGEWYPQATIYSANLHALITWPAFLSPNLVWRLLDRDADDANPAHIIYECLTNTDWGMGSPASLIDVTAFNAAAIELYNEPLGLSMIWTRQAAIQDFVQEVLDHIQGVLFVDPQTGLLTLKLIRGDYDVDALPTISPSTANLSNFGRKLWGDIVNEIVVTWTNPDNEQDETVSAHDLASISTQGGIVSDSRNYYGVRYSDLAMRLAARDLRSAGAPLATFDAEVDRSLWYLRPASVLLVDWPEYGLDGLVARITSIDYGKPGDPTIKLSLIEDVFGLDAADYVSPPSTSWTDPSQPPSSMTEQQALTLPYYLARQGVTDITGAAYPEVLAGVLGASSNPDASGYELWGQVTLADGSTEWQQLAALNLVGHGELGGDLAAEATSTGVVLTSLVGSRSPSRAGFVMIGTAEATSELALVTSASTTFSLKRGVLDTVPRAWATGTPVWFLTSDDLIEDPDPRSVGEAVTYRLLTRTSKGLLSLYAAPELDYTLTDRPWLPLRPANVTIGGVKFNTAATPVDMTTRTNPWVTVTWANRNRLTEDSAVLGWTDATVTPETGQTTTVTVYGADGATVISTQPGISGTTYDVPNAALGLGAEVFIVPTASRTDADGTFESLQGHGIWVQVTSPTAASDTAGGAATVSFAGATIAGGSSLSAAGTSSAAIVGSVGSPAVTLNPSDKNANILLSSGNMVAEKFTTNDAVSVRATRSIDAATDSGYFEVFFSTSDGFDPSGGTFCVIGVSTSALSTGSWPGSDANSWSYYQDDGSKYHSGVIAAYGTPWHARGNVIMVAVKTGSIWFGLNGVWNGDPAAGTGAAFTGLTGSVFPTLSLYRTAFVMGFRAKASDFSYSPPSGFLAWEY